MKFRNQYVMRLTQPGYEQSIAVMLTQVGEEHSVTKPGLSLFRYTFAVYSVTGSPELNHAEKFQLSTPQPSWGGSAVALLTRLSGKR